MQHLLHPLPGYHHLETNEVTFNRVAVNITADELHSQYIDIKTIREGIYRVLDKNQMKHTRNLQKIIEHKMDFVNSSGFIENQKNKYITYLKELETMLQQLNDSELSIRENIDSINQQYNSEASVKGLHRDIEKSHLLTGQEKRLDSLNAVKQEVTQYIIVIKGKLEDLSLRIDKICFDNIVMLNTILKNFMDMTEI